MENVRYLLLDSMEHLLWSELRVMDRKKNPH